MITGNEFDDLVSAGGSVYDQAGRRVGAIRSTRFSTGPEAPQWLALTIGFLGHATTFVPLDKATIEGTDLHVPYSGEIIKDAPRSEDGSLSEDTIRALISHFNLNSDGTEPALFA